jgi:N-acetylmuramoyl-L-alanine amidase
MRKRLFFCFVVMLFSVTLFSFVRKKENQKPLKTIIIDAGHGLMPGGRYNGAKGSYSYEDVLCLAIAKELVADLKEALPEINIVETRPAEDIVPLHRRAEIANQNKGDLFISIHCNAMPPVRHSEVIGTKTVTMYTGKGKKRKRITRRVPEYRYWTTPRNRDLYMGGT